MMMVNREEVEHRQRRKTQNLAVVLLRAHQQATPFLSFGARLALIGCAERVPRPIASLPHVHAAYFNLTYFENADPTMRPISFPYRRFGRPSSPRERESRVGDGSPSKAGCLSKLQIATVSGREPRDRSLDDAGSEDDDDANDSTWLDCKHSLPASIRCPTLTSRSGKRERNSRRHLQRTPRPIRLDHERRYHEMACKIARMDIVFKAGSFHGRRGYLRAG